MPLDSFLIEILVDPEDKEELFYFPDEETLYNPRAKRRYAVKDGIPVMLIEEAETVDENEARRLQEKLPSAVATGKGPPNRTEAS